MNFDDALKKYAKPRHKDRESSGGRYAKSRPCDAVWRK